MRFLRIGVTDADSISLPHAFSIQNPSDVAVDDLKHDWVAHAGRDTDAGTFNRSVRVDHCYTDVFRNADEISGAVTISAILAIAFCNSICVTDTVAVEHTSVALYNSNCDWRVVDCSISVHCGPGDVDWWWWRRWLGRHRRCRRATCRNLCFSWQFYICRCVPWWRWA